MIVYNGMAVKEIVGRTQVHEKIDEKGKILEASELKLEARSDAVWTTIPSSSIFQFPE